MTILDRRALADDYMRKLDHNVEVAPSQFEPIVKSRCICRNMGEPDANGFIAYSPSCRFHGVHSRAPKYDMQIDLEAI